MLRYLILEMFGLILTPPSFFALRQFQQKIQEEEHVFEIRQNPRRGDAQRQDRIGGGFLRVHLLLF